MQRQEGEGRGQGAERCTSLVELRNRTQSIGLVHGACSHVVAPLPITCGHKRSSNQTSFCPLCA